MISIDIPGRGLYELKNLVLDMNGTIAVDGIIQDDILERIGRLSKVLDIYLITADTHGKLESQKGKIAARIERVSPPGEAQQKADFIESLNASSCVAIGNGSNDIEMLKKASLAIVVVDREGCAVGALQVAHIIVNSSRDALDLLLNTNRIIATLRR